MKHTCDAARSGSEKGNTCAACHHEPIRPSIPTGYGDLMGEWESILAKRERMRTAAQIAREEATSSEP